MSDLDFLNLKSLNMAIFEDLYPQEKDGQFFPFYINDVQTLKTLLCHTSHILSKVKVMRIEQKKYFATKSNLSEAKKIEQNVDKLLQSLPIP